MLAPVLDMNPFWLCLRRGRRQLGVAWRDRTSARASLAGLSWRSPLKARGSDASTRPTGKLDLGDEPRFDRSPILFVCGRILARERAFVGDVGFQLLEQVLRVARVEPVPTWPTCTK